MNALKKNIKKFILRLPLGQKLFNLIKYFYFIIIEFLKFFKSRSKYSEVVKTSPAPDIEKAKTLSIFQTKLNIGGGANYRFPNWINLDSKDSDHSFDLSKDEIKLTARSIDLIYSSHTFEHLSNKTVNRLLKDFWRLIKLEPHARVIIKIPDFSQLLKEWSKNNLDYFDFNGNDQWNYKEIAPTFKNKKIKDTINARASYMFCGYWNSQYGDFFGEYDYKRDGSFNGPPPLKDEEYENILKNNTPHEISKILKSKLNNQIDNITFNHQNAWSKDELIQHFELFGFDIISIDKGHICKKYKNDIPDIFGLYNISSYFEFRLRSLNEIYLSWFKYNWYLMKNQLFNNNFEKNGFYFGKLPDENIKKLVYATHNLKPCDLNNLDYPPGYFTGLNPIPSEILKQFNSSSQYYELNNDFILALKERFELQKEKIIENLNSNFKVLNVRYWTTYPNAEHQNSYSFHGDSYPDEIFKIMIYLTPFNKEYGGLEIIDNNSEELIFDESNQIGVYCLFKNTQVLHRGLPGTVYERKAIEITLTRSKINDPFDCLLYGNNAYYPISPKYIDDRKFILD